MTDRTRSALTWPRPALALGLLAVVGATGVALATSIGGLQAVVLMGAAAVALWALVYAPGFLLAFYLLIPLYKGALQPFSSVDLTVLLAVVNAMQLLPLLAERRVRTVSMAGLTLWMGMATLVLAAVLWAPDQSFALGRTVEAWALLFIPIVPACLRVGSEERYLKQVVLTFLGAGLVTVLLGMSSLSGSERLTVLDTNTIQTARAALLVPLIAMMFVPQARSTWVRILAVIASLMAVMVGLASGSRGPLIVVLIIGAVGFLRAVASSRGPDRRTLSVIAVVAVTGVAILASGAIDLPAISTDRFTGFGEFVGSFLGAESSASVEDTSSEARVVLFGFAVELFEQHPLIGAGTGGYPILSPAELGHFEANAYPHNALLQLAAEYGLVGLTIMGVLIILALTRRLPERTYGHAIRLLFVFYLLNAMVSSDVFDDRVTWGLMMLVLLIDILPSTVPARVPSKGTPFVPWPTDGETSPPVAWPVRPAPTGTGPGPYATPFLAPGQRPGPERPMLGGDP
jgi:hypothetical protein